MGAFLEVQIILVNHFFVNIYSHYDELLHVSFQLRSEVWLWDRVAIFLRGIGHSNVIERPENSADFVTFRTEVICKKVGMK